MATSYTSSGTGRNYTVSPLRAMSTPYIHTTMSSKGLVIGANYHAESLVPKEPLNRQQKRRIEEPLMKLNLRTPRQDGYTSPFGFSGGNG